MARSTPPNPLKVRRIETLTGNKGVAMEVFLGPDSPIACGGVLVDPSGDVFRYGTFVDACNDDGYDAKVEGSSRDMVLLAYEHFLTNEAVRVKALRTRLAGKGRK